MSIDFGEMTREDCEEIITTFAETLESKPSEDEIESFLNANFCEHENTSPGDCTICNGTGEFPTPDSSCSSCGGSGVSRCIRICDDCGEEIEE